MLYNFNEFPNIYNILTFRQHSADDEDNHLDRGPLAWFVDQHRSAVIRKNKIRRRRNICKKKCGRGRRGRKCRRIKRRKCRKRRRG